MYEFFENNNKKKRFHVLFLIRINFVNLTKKFRESGMFIYRDINEQRWLLFVSFCWRKDIGEYWNLESVWRR